MNTAFVLSGGGAKGALEAGVISQLVSNGIKPEAMYGTSTGALNSAGYAYLGAEGLAKNWLSITGKKDVLSPCGISWLWGWTRIIWADGIYSTAPLRKNIDKVLSSTPICKAVVCYVELESGEILYTDNSSPNFANAVQASASIPLIMEPVKWEVLVGDKETLKKEIHSFVDGGVREQTPLNKAIEDGYDDIYLILANPIVKNPEYFKRSSVLFKWFESFKRSVDDLMCHEIFLNDLVKAADLYQNNKIKIHLYAPDKKYIDTLDFSPTAIRNAYNVGLNIKEQELQWL